MLEVIRVAQRESDARTLDCRDVIEGDAGGSLHLRASRLPEGKECLMCVRGCDMSKALEKLLLRFLAPYVAPRLQISYDDSGADAH